MHYAGIIFALIALLSWAFGDYFIQKTTRYIGSWKALFFIGITGFVGLLPFVWNEIFVLTGQNLLLLALLCVVVIFAALFDFEALRQGKIAVVEPILGLELPITVGLSISLGKETLSVFQIFLIGLVFFGIVLAITAHYSHLHYHRRIFEKGVILAGVGAIGMALVNFLVGVSSQEISPLMTIWFSHTVVALFCGSYLFAKNELRHMWKDLNHHKKPVIFQSVLDNLAWIAYGYSTTLIPISIATTISESYIALAVLLGLILNKEKLKKHQLAGVFFAVAGVIALSYLSP